MSGYDGHVLKAGMTWAEAKVEAERLAEELAKDACAFAESRGWKAHYERHGDRFIIFTDGIQTNAIEIVSIR